MIKWKIL